MNRIFNLELKSSLITSLRYWCTNNNQGKQPPQTLDNLTNEKVQQLIVKWIKNNKVCLFMKGNPQNPRCGFSKLMVQILKFYKIQKYKSIDILENDLVREQVKLYSKWPTYPQLFIDGELIGGSDVVNQMHHDDSLEKLLKNKKIIF